MDTKQDILINIYNKLRFAGIVLSRKDFAEKLEYNYTCISSAFGGSERYLNNKFFAKIIKTFPQVNPKYVEEGEGDVLINLDIPVYRETKEVKVDMEMLEKMVALIEKQNERTERALEQTDKALEQVNKLIDIITKMK